MTDEQFRNKCVTFARRIQPVYEALEWRWTAKVGAYTYVPSVNDIVATLAECYRDINRRGVDTRSSRGGLFVERKDGVITIGFEDFDEVDA